MKHIKLASAVAIAMGITFAGVASAASSNGGTITFTGTVADTTCTVTGGSGTDGGQGNFSVALDNTQPSDLAAAGDTSEPKAFTVQIGAPGQGSCTDGKVASMSFLTSSPRIDAATGALKNALSGEATNVQIQLTDSNGAINLADPSYSQQSPEIANNTASIPFSAQYLAVGGAATPGLISTSVVYAVNYN
ncbi:type 1 fimbrial protein [Dyella sp. M7H15-1]|uniref:fimbrial protein n=1 Tax=Dyella sp. M7H15-1 TaxID=2501295 RepID=UPI001004F0B0|nr:fimbrial protein [Dyella sp. M7H15-1]QAU24793.1 type 1 fimbrial protein [Dyella sp. M7H15-1]